MRRWTVDAATRFLDDVGEGVGADLPLFRGLGPVGPPGDARVERVDDATMSFWIGLVRAAARGPDGRPAELRRGDRLRAVAVPGGPALLAVRPRPGRSWRALLVPAGATAERILERVPDPDGLGRAA